MSHFKLVSSTKASDIIPVNKYVSEKTGLTVIIANVEGPIVNGFFCLATEAHDDDGLPHTLEHLIFLGSKRYPYKGVLDLLANRCMAHGTNAWTDTDHTCYTIDTAGDAGMLTLLPIYIDHILQPTLTDEGFITEVHHIDGDGEDAGVVYCEMQGRENTADSRCELKILRAMYPNHGYSAETGGIMENLRTSTNNIKVREFHKKFYRAENLTIILTGQIEAQDVFAALQTVEDDIIAKRMTEPQEEWVKPWQTLPPPPNYIQMTEQWPADTVDCGQVGFGWRGPLLCEPGALKELTGCAVLLRYLSDTAAAPLQRCLVEQEDALAGDVIYSMNENMATLIRIDLKNVPANKLEEARDKALLALQYLRDGDDPLDMERLATLVRKQLRETIASLESDPHQAVAFRCIGDALYSQNEKDFISRMNPQETLLELLEENEDFWMLLLNKYFSCELVVLVGKPSTELQQKMAEDEKKRIEQQRAELGVHGLTQKAIALQEAMEYNERPPPPGMLSSVPVPSCENLKCHTIKTWSSDSAPCPYFNLKEIPMFARVHSLKTNLVYMTILMDTSEAAQSTRQWTPLLLDAMAECGVWRDGKLIPHEEVIATTEAITVSYSGGIGMGKRGNFAVGSFGQFLNVEVRCEPADYEEVVNHIYEILYAPELTKERLLVFTQRLLNDVAQVRRNGNKMAFDVLRDSLYNKESNVHWTSVLRQQKFLKNILDQLTAGGDSAEAVLIQAREEMKNITKRIWLHLASDFERYQLSTEPWKLFARHNLTTAPPKLIPDWELMSEGTGGCVVGVGGVESAFLVALSPGPRGAALVDIAPLLLALNYFTQLEGPMWRLIRGCGLSYSYGVRLTQTEARLMFTLYRATNVLAAYTKAKSIVEEFLENGEFDEDLFASAKSTALFEAIDKEKCPADVVALSLHDYLMQRPEDYNKQMVCALGAVRQGEARGAAQKWLPHLFVAGRTAIACHPTKVQDVQAAFEKINVKLDAYKSMEESYFNE